jgi:protein NrfC
MDQRNTILESKGYLLYDPKKCAGCKSCMLACSLVHEGEHNLSLSRIQIIDNPFGQFPTDINIKVCRQCKYPLCVEACPVNALYIDKDYKYIRIVDEEKCTGCQSCLSACPFTPSMMIWNPKKRKSVKCDLCKDTPYWGEEGKLVCVEVCPTGALKFRSEPPRVPGPEGYVVNLRGEGWKKLDLPVEGGD